LSGAFVLAALALSAFAQLALRTGRTSQGVAAALLALAAGVAAGRLAAAPAPEPCCTDAPGPGRAWLPTHFGFAAAGALALALVLALSAADRAYGVQLAAWAVAALAWSASYLARPIRPPRAGAEAAILAALFAIGLAARGAALGTLPAGLYGDEAEFGLRALAVLHDGGIAPFTVVFDQHPSLYHWVQAGGMALFGTGIAGLRAAAAFAGALTVPVFYLLLRRDLGRGGAAAGALLLACSPLHVHLSRIASNNAWVGLCTVGALAALYRLIRTGAPPAAVHAGTWLGVCFLFGNKAVGLPPAMLAAFAGVALGGNVALRRAWRPLLLLLAVAFLVFLPEAVHYVRTGWYGPLLVHPVRRLIDLDAAGGPGPAAVLAGQLGRALLTFVALPDRSPFTVGGGFTIVAAAEGAFALVGAALAASRPRRPLAGLLLGWLAIALATNVLDTNPPQANHLIGVSMLPAAFAALAIHALAGAIAAALRRPIAAPAAALAIAVGIAAQSAAHYVPAGLAGGVFAVTTEFGRVMQERAASHDLAFVTPRMSWDLISTWKYMAPGVRARYKLVELDPRAQWLEPGGRDVAFVVHESKLRLLPVVRARYPDGALEERRGRDGRLLAVVYVVPRSAIDRVESALPPTRAPAGRPGSR
jgi:4-amino-4-deoxy-L-arabinose transferase-like glycosyltransferase